jgi:hypothetical protein
MVAKLTDGGFPAAEEIAFVVLCVPVDLGAVGCAQVSKGRRKWVVVDNDVAVLARSDTGVLLVGRVLQ